MKYEYHLTLLYACIYRIRRECYSVIRKEYYSVLEESVTLLLSNPLQVVSVQHIPKVFMSEINRWGDIHNYTMKFTFNEI